MDDATLNRMKMEIDELSNRIDRLEIFIKTDVFFHLPLKQRILCYQQSNFMKAYYHVLKERYLFYKENQNE